MKKNKQSRMAVHNAAVNSGLLFPEEPIVVDKGHVPIKKKNANVRQGRKHYTLIQDQELFAEVDGKCPLCGKPLVAEKRGKQVAAYDRAHIYPHSPTEAQQNALKAIPKPSDIESPENIILLCKPCHKLQDYRTTAEDFLALYVLKQEKAGAFRAAQEMARIDIEQELKTVLNRLLSIKDSQLEELSYIPLRVKKKIEAGALCRKVLGYVTQYYKTAERLFRELDDRQSSTFELIALQFHQAFCKQEQKDLLHDKQSIFDALVEWVMSKTKTSRSVCEAVVSFFIQNCEVFREISK